MRCSDARSGRVVLVCHCLCNANAKVCDMASYGGVYGPVILATVEAEVGLIQLPCPETLFMGLGRWWQGRSQYDTPAYRKHCAALAEQVVDQVVIYRNAGMEVIGMLGVEGSPSCGLTEVYDHPDWGGRPADVDTANARSKGRGIWAEELDRCFERRGVAPVPEWGVPNESKMEPEAIYEAVCRFLEPSNG